MLTRLDIRDVVLIDRLEIDAEPGLAVLTGETGAGKSILLDALGLALGARSETGLVRAGAAQATVSAAFEIAEKHPAFALMSEAGLPAEQPLVLRRTVSADGKSRAFVNDQSISVGLLRRIGDTLVEIHGQFDQRGLLDPQTHRELLDSFGGLAREARATAEAHGAWREAAEALATAEADAGRARSEESFLAASVEELQRLDPKPGEESALTEERTLLANAGRLVETINAALADLVGERGAERAIGQAQRALARVQVQAGSRLDPALAGLDRAAAELSEASRALSSIGSALDLDPRKLEEADDRLHALREAARKHGVAVDALAELRATLETRLEALRTAESRIGALTRAVETARASYAARAEELSKGRAKAAKKLDKRVDGELAPLKLDRAKFETRIEPLAESDWGIHGKDRIQFVVATNPGAAPGPLAKIASGGELARFTLALKVVLAETQPTATLIFDEVDAGVGGAVAAAVGDRLKRLSRDMQVLVVTHSPQVAARGDHHWRVSKRPKGGAVPTTKVEPLAEPARREEIARMLAGAEITDAARAAADALIEGAGA
ncbi:MAG: DNA repair protein RecN [Alphaproteobacteria bacterium]|nr:DNA repair protein RecN [Alphaproteobacteria bacterium]